MMEDEKKLPELVSSLASLWASRAESLATEVIGLREVAVSFYDLVLRKDFGDLLSLLVYSGEMPSRRKRKRMNVEELVGQWLPLVKKLALAHDVDEKDEVSSKLDDLLLPIVAAPIVQIREFYRKLVGSLKADKEVPWAVWKMFEFWGENVLDKVEKEHIVGMKKEIAARIAENSVKQIPTEDWIKAMLGALQWRSVERLEKIEASLEAGEKPRVRGKESCLFLLVGESEVQL